MHLKSYSILEGPSSGAPICPSVSDVPSSFKLLGLILKWSY
jgi:hypothetical protein